MLSLSKLHKHEYSYLFTNLKTYPSKVNTREVLRKEHCSPQKKMNKQSNGQDNLCQHHTLRIYRIKGTFWKSYSNRGSHLFNASTIQLLQTSSWKKVFLMPNKQSANHMLPYKFFSFLGEKKMRLRKVICQFIINKGPMKGPKGRKFIPLLVLCYLTCWIAYSKQL